MAIENRTRLSVRLFSLLTLIVFALMSVGMILYTTFSMQQVALKAQNTSMERVIEIATIERMRHIHYEAMSLGQTISQRPEIKNAYKNYLSTGKTLSLQHKLSDPLLNGHNFSSSLDLVWLRSYDLQFKLVADSSDDLSTKFQELPASIIEYLAQRKGVDRMQAYAGLWRDSMNNPLYSVVLPIGGLRPKGYIEVVINPLFNLPHIGNMIQMPIKISKRGGMILFQSKQAIDKTLFMPINYWLKGVDKQPVIQITAYADTALLESQTDKTSLQSVIFLMLLSGTLLLLSIWLLNHYLFQPLKDIISKLDEYEKDETVTIPNEGLLELHILANAFNRLLIRLHERNQEMTRLSVLDGLTGIANRRCFDAYLQQQWQHAKKVKQPLSLLLIDIDHFKLYNDYYGHQQGDVCLRQVAKIIEQTLDKEDDMAARYGGEEFTVVLPNTKKSDAKKVAERIMGKLNQYQLKHGKSPTDPCVTISIGISSCFPAQVTTDEACLIGCTDVALYQAKELGRNRYFVTGGCKKFDLEFNSSTVEV
ncbi:MAG: GGDEF domain-containing protein [Pseudomonadota bacterium]